MSSISSPPPVRLALLIQAPRPTGQIDPVRAVPMAPVPPLPPAAKATDYEPPKNYGGGSLGGTLA